MIRLNIQVRTSTYIFIEKKTKDILSRFFLVTYPKVEPF